MARSLPETLTEAVRATVWERDQEAWNTPRQPAEPTAREELADSLEAGADPARSDEETPPEAPEQPE